MGLLKKLIVSSCVLDILTMCHIWRINWGWTLLPSFTWRTNISHAFGRQIQSLCTLEWLINYIHFQCLMLKPGLWETLFLERKLFLRRKTDKLISRNGALEWTRLALMIFQGDLLSRLTISPNYKVWLTILKEITNKIQRFSLNGKETRMTISCISEIRCIPVVSLESLDQSLQLLGSNNLILLIKHLNLIRLEIFIDFLVKKLNSRFTMKNV